MHEITKAIADSETNIRGAEIKGEGAFSYGILAIEVKNIRHLNKTIKKIKKVKGVINVERAKEVELFE